MHWSVDALAAAGCRPIVVVVPPSETASDDLDAPVELILVRGGTTRQESVAAGLEEVTSSAVVVHDAVRPLLTVDLVRRVLEALREADGAVAAVPVVETLKRAVGREVQETVARAGLWQAQTPQAFKTERLRAAHALARRESFVGTDDAQLIERYGGSVALVEGSRRNIKITYPEDFVLAEAMMRLQS